MTSSKRVTLRASQLVTTFGPGSMVDLPTRSGTDVPATVLTSRVFLPNVAAAASEE